MTTDLKTPPPIGKVSLVYTYYENPLMLRRLLKHLDGFSKELRDRIELVIVDDGSPNTPAATVITSKPLLPVRVFRLIDDIPWNHRSARNIGAFEAAHEWLFLLDMDMEIPYETLTGLFHLPQPLEPWYLFSSRPIESSTHTLGRHHDAIFMSKEFYWKVGGFDENFAGYYGVGALFGIECEKLAPFVHLKDLWVNFVGTETIEDADTRGLARKASITDRVIIRIKRLSRALGLLRRKTLSHRYTRVL